MQIFTDHSFRSQGHTDSRVNCRRAILSPLLIFDNGKHSFLLLGEKLNFMSCFIFCAWCASTCKSVNKSSKSKYLLYRLWRRTHFLLGIFCMRGKIREKQIKWVYLQAVCHQRHAACIFVTIQSQADFQENTTRWSAAKSRCGSE